MLRDMTREYRAEAGQYLLVIDRRWRSHEQLAANELVLVAVVRQPVPLLSVHALAGIDMATESLSSQDEGDACAEDTPCRRRRRTNRLHVRCGSGHLTLRSAKEPSQDGSMGAQ